MMIVKALCILQAIFIYRTEAVVSLDDVDHNTILADRYDWSKHPCKRTCTNYEPPRECKYVFVVEELSSMSKACYDCPMNTADCSRIHCMPTDGNQKKLVVVNRQLPGPTIEVCQNDVVIVEVYNQMDAQSTTIHWHGVHQEGTPFMDGVPMVTQCPIPPGDSFTYSFKVTSCGTHFWHSHIGHQRLDGHFGALIVNAPPKNNPHLGLYDADEHRMVVTDWLKEPAEDKHIRDFYYQITTFDADFLINGLGPRKSFGVVDGHYVHTPYAIFKVSKGYRYRFRLINAGSGNCPVSMSIDKHTMEVISLDGNDVEPVEVDAITSWPGERVDFVVKANRAPGNYWIRYIGFGRCQRSATDGVNQGAILQYAEVTADIPRGLNLMYGFPSRGYDIRVLNPYDSGTESLPTVNISIPYLTSLVEDDVTLKKYADLQAYISFDFNQIDNRNYHREGLYGMNQVHPIKRIGTPQLNHLTLRLQQFPLLSQWQQIGPNTLCNTSTVNREVCEKSECSCTHVIEVPLNAVLELFFIDEGRFSAINHPFHIHGHSFRVIAEEKLDGPVTLERIMRLDRKGKIVRRLYGAPLKDTMKTPGAGYSIVRFHATNPGYWLFHCHFEDHMKLGMALIIKVGEHEDFPKLPYNFPKCGMSSTPY